MFKSGMINQLQKQAAKMKENLENIEVEGQSGGGLVKVTLAGMGKLKGVKIAPEAMDEDSEFLEDLIMAASNDAQAKLEKEVEKVSGPLGGMGLF